MERKGHFLFFEGKLQFLGVVWSEIRCFWAEIGFHLDLGVF